MGFFPKFKLNPIAAKERFSFGIDIGAESIKAVKLKLVRDTAELCAFDIVNSQLDLAEAIKKIKQSQEIDNANISVSGPATVIRYINFPKMTQDELKQALKFEAQKNIPFSVSEVNLDSYILKDNLPDNKMLVLIAAVKKDYLYLRLKIFEDAGIRVNSVSMDSIALVNAFNFGKFQANEKENHKACALLNIGASVSNLNIIEEGLPRLSRDIHIAGNNFTQKIADVFSVQFKEAEALKRSPDAEKANKVVAAVDSVLSNLAAEIRTSFDYYESQSTSSVIKIYLSGGGAKFAGLKDMLANFLGIEVEYWDPLKQVSLSSKIEEKDIKGSSGQLGVSIGLGLY